LKVARTHSFAVPSAGLWIDAHEFAAMAGLPAWHVALFCHLVCRSNFKTGSGRTGYGELINALTPDQPERGPRLWAPTRRDVQRALDRLEVLRLVACDTLSSEQLQCLVFHVAPRVRRGVPAGKQVQELARGSAEGKEGKTRAGTRDGLPTVNLYPLPPVDRNLSTGTRPVHVTQRLEAVKAAVAARGAIKRAPKGA